MQYYIIAIIPLHTPLYLIIKSTHPDLIKNSIRAEDPSISNTINIFYGTPRH